MEPEKLAEARERLMGAEIARSLGVGDVIDTIKDPSSCYKTIFDKVIADKGLAALADGLKKGPANWSSLALQMVPDLGTYRDAIAAQAGHVPDPNAAAYGDAVSSLTLFQDGCYSGIFRINETGDARNLFKGNRYVFSPGALGIAPGTKMQCYFGIQDGGGVNLQIAPGTFTFQPASTKVAHFVSVGAVATNASFMLVDYF